MIDLSKFHLITPEEDAGLYKAQCEALENINCNESDAFLRVALLLTLPPVSDYRESVRLLKACFDDAKDIRFAIGAYLSSEWLPDEPNAFLGALNEKISVASEQNKAVIYYLNAYDIFKRGREREDREKIVYFSERSIRHTQNCAFFYNYYYLARVSDKTTAKAILEKSMPCIRVISDEECAKLDPYDLIDYDSFVDEHILGVCMTAENFAVIREFFDTL